jgi:dephospho-CoA kinase
MNAAYTTKTGVIMNVDKVVVGLAGMPGAGKSVVVETAREQGYAVVTMGDVVREETSKRGLELTPQNVGKVMLQLREEGGNRVIADKCIPKIESQPSRKILVDGLRSLQEVDAFKAYFSKFSLLAVHSPPETRFHRLFNRHRSDDPTVWEVFHERDTRELSVGVGNVIAMAERLVVNDNSVSQFKAKVKENLARIEMKWNN